VSGFRRQGVRPSACRRACRRAAGCAGFTLTELMVVVLITGVLATLGFVSLKGQVKAAWAVEGLNMVQSIRAAQERWRGEHMLYLDVSDADDSWYPMDPREPTNREQMFSFYYEPGSGVHVDQEDWLLLRPEAPSAVRFGYKVNAGSAGVAMPVPEVAGSGVAIPSPPAHNWYVIQAVGDTDWDGNTSYYIATSLSMHVFSVNAGESTPRPA
jgi:prepilin-type N-terminal cleavage/methylation domain-containing protein